MATAKQLYQYQVVDQDIKTSEDTLKKKIEQQKESAELAAARAKLAEEKKRLENLRKQQRDLEKEAADLTAKLAFFDEQLYGGKVKNPKELSNIQAESKNLKARRDELDGKSLVIMDQVEHVQFDVEAAASLFTKAEAQWQVDQKQLVTDIEQLRTRLVELQKSLATLGADIDAESMEMYRRIKKSRGTAVAKMEQGMCKGCRISASASEIQRARGSKLTPCTSCGRIIYLP